MNDEQPTLRDLLSPKARAWVYVILTLASAAYGVAVVIYDLPEWVAIIVAVVNAAGFQLARSNTPAPEPPPAL